MLFVSFKFIFTSNLGKHHLSLVHLSASPSLTYITSAERVQAAKDEASSRLKRAMIRSSRTLDHQRAALVSFIEFFGSFDGR